MIFIFFLLSIFRPGFSYKDKKLSAFTALKESQVGDKKRERVLQKGPSKAIKLRCLAMLQKKVF